jgi:hypothetical protein
MFSEWWYTGNAATNDKIHTMVGWFLVFNSTFSNISAISWRPVLVVEEARVP